MPCLIYRQTLKMISLVKLFLCPDKGHLKEVGGYSGRNVGLQLTTIKMRTTVEKITPTSYLIQTIQIRHAGHCWRIKDILINNVFLWTPTHGHTNAGRPTKIYLNISTLYRFQMLSRRPGVINVSNRCSKTIDSLSIRMALALNNPQRLICL